MLMNAFYHIDFGFIVYINIHDGSDEQNHYFGLANFAIINKKMEFGILICFSNLNTDLCVKHSVLVMMMFFFIDLNFFKRIKY